MTRTIRSLASIADIPNETCSKESTAQILARHFEAQGITRDAIRDTHLASLYEGLAKSANTPLGSGDATPKVKPAARTVDDVFWGLIVETREHPALEKVVSQYSRKLGIGIQLMHGVGNEHFIRESPLASLIDEGKIILTRIETDSLTLRQYNLLFLSQGFWNALSGRNKILVFQTDTMLNDQSEHVLSDFLDFDYIGSKWDRLRPIGMTIDGGTGGLSLRDWGKSVECLKRFSPAFWPGGEDGYFGFHLDLMGEKVGSEADCARFSTEFESTGSSFGGHKIVETPTSESLGGT